MSRRIILESRPVFSHHLPEPRHTGNGVEAPGLPAQVLVRFIGQAGSRSDHAHLSPQHVEELR